MKKLLVLILSLCVFGEMWAFNQPVTPANQLPAYYESIDGESGKDLLDAIQQVAKRGYRSEDFRYDSVWLAYKYTDLRPDGYIWEIYSDCVFEYEKDRTSNTSQTGECKGYNREHAMCQSWFSEYDLQGVKMSSSKKNSPGSDIFHIYPTSYGMNSRRGNRPYGEVSQSNYTSGNGSKYGTSVSSVSVENSVAGTFVEGSINMSTNVFEPADEYKGDIARSYFGTMVKWAGEWAFNKAEEGRVIFDATIDVDTHYGPENNYGFTDYGLALMLSWHRQDPVSQKEVDRNNGIQLTQGNRNPFIDYPYLVEYIWGEMSGEKLDFDQLLCSADELFELGVSNGYLGEVVEKQLDTIFWMVGNTQHDYSLVNHGARPRYLPEAPNSCSSTSTTFIGWTSAPISGVSASVPEVLYTQPSDFPTTNSNTCYYAVFAEALQVDNPSQVISLNKSDSTDWKISSTKQTSNSTDGAYWLLVKNASITSPVVDLASLDSVTITMRSYQSKKTVVITTNGVNVGQLSASTNTMQSYLWTATALSGKGSLVFSSTDGTASYGPGIKAISLHLGGTKATYTNYITHCDNGTATETVGQMVQSTSTKLLLDGQLLIVHDGKTYNAQGNLIN